MKEEEIDFPCPGGHEPQRPGSMAGFGVKQGEVK
jgi:hypothetical protein